jgi:hypothetical protein
MKCISVHKNTFCTYISVTRSLKNFPVIRNFLFCGNVNSVRGIHIHVYTKSSKKQIEDIQNKNIANKTKKMINVEDPTPNRG